MAKKMLIDATHDEEVRVAIVDGNRLEEFDSETSTKRQIKGNIYLAKVIRIEPSLQAAFVEFGGNRHGFLPFGEIHPDYFRIPVSDRSSQEGSDPNPLLPEGEEKTELEAAIPEKKKGKKPRSKGAKAEAVVQESAEVLSEPIDAPAVEDSEEPGIDLVDEDEPPRRPRNYHYKIQEVIKRRQIMLIQVVKEERGNKGAALTTYLSLPGRYCVLMPNAGHRGGGISRKISDGSDRRRLRDVLKELEIPEGMSLIVRTAGQERNKLEIRRDFDYLLRLWEEIRETTLKATAPELIYTEGNLIKRSIRDVYNRDIDEILVEGEEAYKTAKAFMKALIPSHTKKVQPYRDPVPLFYRHKVEEQIDAMMYPMAKLPSGGSIVINTTEALVAIDVNSGRSTKERHIDETALKTNLEAADEIARQMRLRDLAGLVVIDFIDMNEQKHIQAVEKRLKEATRHDRARIQLGHISQFGLLELSRQRLHPSLIETNSAPCSHCRGTGLVRSVESMSLLVLRAIENKGIEGRSAEILVTVPTGIDLYLLNQKRASLTAAEARYQMHVTISRDDTLISPDFQVECLAERKTPVSSLMQLSPVVIPADQEEEEQDSPVLSSEEQEKEPFQGTSHHENGGRRRRRLFKRRDTYRNPKQGDYSKGMEPSQAPSIKAQIVDEILPPESKNAKISEAPSNAGPDQKTGETKSEGNGDQARRRRRRGRRGQRHGLPKEGGASPASTLSPSESKGEASVELLKPVKSVGVPDVKPKEVVVPMAVLPEGPESSSKKNLHSRWWKRLLES